jgi:hypothetical protein
VLLLNPDFDLRQSMGEVLSDNFPMTTFPRIVAAYKTVFRDETVCDTIHNFGVRSLVCRSERTGPQLGDEG